MIYRFIYEKTQLAKGKTIRMVEVLNSLNDTGIPKMRIWYLSISDLKADI